MSPYHLPVVAESRRNGKAAPATPAHPTARLDRIDHALYDIILPGLAVVAVAGITLAIVAIARIRMWIQESDQ